MASNPDPRELIISFAVKHPEVRGLQFIRDDPGGIHIELIEGHGIVNYVYRVQSTDNKSSVIIKYGEEAMRCVPEEKVPLQRQEVEYNSLCLMHSIQPGSAPQPLCLDKKHHILAMSDMSDWELLGTQLEERHIDLQAATRIGQLLATVHFETSKDNVSKEEWEELKRKFGQEEMTEEHVKQYTMARRYDETDPITNVSQDNLGTLRKYIEEMRRIELPEKLSQLYNMQMCFIHADCHYKSIFVKGGQVALFDFECAILGHPAFDVSFPMACYVAAIVFDEKHVTDEQMAAGMSVEEFRTACLSAMRNLIEAYLGVEKNISKSEKSQRKFLSDLTLFTGNIVFMVGTFAHVKLVLERLNDEDRGRMMDAGFRIMKGHDKVKTVDDFIELMSPNSST